MSEEVFKGLFTVAGTWGMLTQTVESNHQKIKVEIVKNNLRIRKIVLEKLRDKIRSVEAYLDGSKIEPRPLGGEDEVEITFEKVSLAEGSVLSIDIGYE